MGCLAPIAFGGVQPASSYTLSSMTSMLFLYPLFYDFYVVIIPFLLWLLFFFIKDYTYMKEKARDYSLIFFSLGVIALLVNVLALQFWEDRGISHQESLREDIVEVPHLWIWVVKIRMLVGPCSLGSPKRPMWYIFHCLNLKNLVGNKTRFELCEFCV